MESMRNKTEIQKLLDGDIDRIDLPNEDPHCTVSIEMFDFGKKQTPIKIAPGWQQIVTDDMLQENYVDLPTWFAALLIALKQNKRNVL